MSTETLLNRIDNDFTYHRPNDEKTGHMASIRFDCHSLAEKLISLVPEGRELSLALTYLEQVSMWANAGIARQQ